jgi:hypothetical protein
MNNSKSKKVKKTKSISSIKRSANEYYKSTATLVHPQGFKPCEFSSCWHNKYMIKNLFKSIEFEEIMCFPKLMLIF